MRARLLIVALLVGSFAQAQPVANPVAPNGVAPENAAPQPLPKRTIPPQVLFEVRELERQFDLALVHDCAPERCVSKGCTYRDHVAVDLPPSTTSLPGLGQSDGPGSVAPQLYLTQARCEFAHEKSVATRDVEALVRRLEQRLSKGWMKVTVSRQVLEPISPSLSESPPPKEDKPPPPKEEPKPEPVVPPAAQEWDAAVALRELWQTLLPHFSWMIAVFLLTVAALTLIWGARRLGKESLEEKALLAQLTAEQPAAPEAPAEPAAETAVPDADAAFVSAQQELWSRRIAEAPLEKDDALVGHLLRQWLRQGDLPMLAKATVLFGDRLSMAFAADPTLAPKKAELARYLQTVDLATLPADGAFFKTLNQHSVAASLLAQPDTEVYQSLEAEFGAAAIVQLIERLSARQGALLFGLTPPDRQDEVARLLPPAARLGVAHQLLLSNRSSKHERAALYQTLTGVREGRPLNGVEHDVPGEVLDQGQPFDAAGALSVLLATLDDADRKALFAEALARSGSTFPRWYEDILSVQMVLKVPSAARTDLLLEVDVRALAGWLSLQTAPRREALVAGLSPSVQTAVAASLRFGSRAEQLALARRGHLELVASVKRRLAQGALSFTELVA